MSSFKVEVVAVDNVVPHPNADRLDLAQVKGWNVVVARSSVKPGDLAIYLPVDSVLPPDLEQQLFPPDSKIKLSKSRIRSIKIRGAISQGMLIEPEEVEQMLAGAPVSLGDDLTEALGVKKFEPPEPEYSGNPKLGVKTGGRAQINPNFNKYSDIENIKNFNTVFQDGEQVYISEKLHGTSARYGYVPRHYTDGVLGRIRSWADKALISLGLMREHTFVYGSRNVQLHTGVNKSWYKENVYAKIAAQEDFERKLNDGECVYGEIVGHAIQKNYSYGCDEGQHRFFAYDVKVDGRWLDYAEFVDFCDSRGIPRVPELYVGPYSKEVELKHRDGDSTVGGQKVREGVVIKPVVEAIAACGRKVLKSISDAYYLADNSDYH